MPQGFFTIEQWKRTPRGGKPHWAAVCHLDGYHRLSDAIAEINRRGKPGFFRVIQTQRMIWAEKKNGRLKLGARHAMTPKGLAKTAKAFDRDGGRSSVKSS